MKEVNDRELLNHFLKTYQIESIFNGHLRQHLSLYSFQQGELICSQGEQSQNLYIFVKGKLKIYTTSVEGKTLILAFKAPLELIGDIEYVRDIEIINTVEAVSSGYLIGIHYKWLKKYATDSLPFTRFLLEIITEKFHIKSNSLRFNLMYPVEVRLASYLLSVSFEESEDNFQEQLKTDSLPDAANLIGTSYRHLNRVLSQFRSKGLIERKKGYIVVEDRQGLREIAGHNIYE
ncbi:Crp/Fnr family transcriptional regulator [Bacillus solimangrovi]|uniref:Crp/Fnr family transcriptional regulator n=1 Tax=Bacillus solimangrovi TaxID=1305675 RepID=A0A1E5LHQ9_9BACI|nr:helix-turn-helix domain-containing protein [Bacillus solimangrovi]OEH93622.1 Crp/Fnr family transcriptional regulator [Bacillus solimangrovi]